MTDILGQALYDFYYNNNAAELWIHNQYGPKEEMPVNIFFRDNTGITDLELCALSHCRGNVLDIGAGAGSHALHLQQKNVEVTAADISALAISVMKARGVIKAQQADIFAYNDQRYDTLLLMMNGIGLAGTLNKLRTLLSHLKKLLKPGGQLLFDSSDIAYLYQDIPLPANNYYGELRYQYEYKNKYTEWFNWLYIDQNTLTTLAKEEGWATKILFEDEYDQYLAKLTLK